MLPRLRCEARARIRTSVKGFVCQRDIQPTLPGHQVLFFISTITPSYHIPSHSLKGGDWNVSI